MTMSVPSSSPLIPGLRAPAPADAWGIALPVLLVVLVAIGVLYRETAEGMVAIWLRSRTFTHAFLVPPISLWLLWRLRDRLASIAPRANPWMLVPAGLVALVWLLGELAAVNAITELAFVALLVLAVSALLGGPLVRAAAFPLAFLFFAVPVGDFLLPWLMQRTADFTVAALRASGVAVYREGLLFVIPSGSWSVVEACSGVRYLLASLMVGTLYAYLTYRSTRRRLAFMAVALAVPLLANWVRAYLIVMLGHLSNNQIATGVDHLIYGWLFFGVVIVLLYAVGQRWAEAPVAPAGPERGIRSPATAPRGAIAPGRAGTWTLAAVAGAFVLVAAAPLSAQHAIALREAAAAPAFVAPDTLGAGWIASRTADVDWQPRLDNPSSEAHAVYIADGLPAVSLHVAYYRNQDERRKLGDTDSLLAQSEDKRWRRVAEGRREIAIAGTTLVIRTAELGDRDEMSGGVGATVSAAQLYWVDGTFTGSDVAAKTRVALGRLFGRGDDAAEIVVAASGATPAAGDAAIDEFLRANLGALEARLARVRSQR